jgi:CheY-like chemotaxis protein
METRGIFVLFVDDNFICNLDIREYLQAAGFHVEAVFCAAAAFEVLAKHREQLSALVTDIDLGPGPDGFEVARRARALYPDLPVVFISGTAQMRFPAQGVDGSWLLAKPFHPQRLVESINRAVRLEAA